MEELEHIYVEEEIAGRWELYGDLPLYLQYNSNGKLGSLVIDEIVFNYNWNCK